MCSFVLTCLTAIENILVVKYPENGEEIDKMAIFLFPAVWILVHPVIFAMIKRARKVSEEKRELFRMGLDDHS